MSGFSVLKVQEENKCYGRIELEEDQRPGGMSQQPAFLRNSRSLSDKANILAPLSWVLEEGTEWCRFSQHIRVSGEISGIWGVCQTCLSQKLGQLLSMPSLGKLVWSWWPDHKGKSVAEWPTPPKIHFLMPALSYRDLCLFGSLSMSPGRIRGFIFVLVISSYPSLLCLFLLPCQTHPFSLINAQTTLVSGVTKCSDS